MARLLRLLPDPTVLTNLEAWIRRRLRSYLWRQWQNGHNRFNELRRRGVSKFKLIALLEEANSAWGGAFADNDPIDGGGGRMVCRTAPHSPHGHCPFTGPPNC